jgi:signal transduction histidine kinase
MANWGAARPRLGTALVFTLSVAMLAAAIAFAWLRATLPSEPAMISSDFWHWSAAGVEVLPLGDAGPFQDGDVVTGVGGIPLDTLAGDALRPGLRNSADTLPRTLHVAVDRRGNPIQLDVTLVPQPVGALLIAGLALLGYTVVQAVVALLAFLRRPGEAWRRGFLIGSVGNIASAVIWQLGLRPTDLARPERIVLLFVLGASFHLLFWSSVVHVIASWPARANEAIGRKPVIAALYGLPQVALVAGVGITRAVAPSSLEWVGSWEVVLAAVVLVLIGLVLVVLGRAYLRTPAGHDRWLRIVIASCLAGALAVGLLSVLPVLLIGEPLATRSAVASLGLPLAVVLIVGSLRNQLFEVDVLLASRRRLVVAREEERRRLRRDLHDGIGPMLAAMTLKVDLARDAVHSNPAAADAALVALKADTQAAVAEVRRLTRDLRPPALDELGVVDAIRQRAVDLGDGADDARLEIAVEVAGALPRLDAAVEAAAYRIALEAMTNVVRHAGARHCRVRLAGNGALVVEVADDGAGFAAGRGAGVGMMSMRERCTELGGSLTVERTADGWTKVRAVLPVAS